MFGCSMLSASIILSRWTLIEPTEVPQHNSFAVAEVGGSFTLRCPVLDDNFIYWHKQTLGNKGQTVATSVYGRLSLQGEFTGTRFNITKEDSQFLLTIRNVTKEDEATYICLSGTTYSLTLANNVFLAVKDPNKEKCVSVKQHPKTESVVPGNSVNLQCSLHSKTEENKVQCPDEHSVYWFRAGAGESSRSLIYTQKHRTEERETSCGYSLSRTIQNSSDAGTYYCAVVTCGRILFGDGTNVETKICSESRTGPSCTWTAAGTSGVFCFTDCSSYCLRQTKKIL
ncbi:uncharacterized protein LOC129604742 isoform X2 [Betta splendens]|uniref:Uncharacterized protein LOC129604742 isoform X2 n=1 Tax=Betta splendens TaxID=158456 RepID=A0A9W2Y3L1_BETSP|nr:uncharacterized protein LOC129604742 isoform X2 [Betta splendens]